MMSDLLIPPKRRILCMWFPRLHSDRALRLCPQEGPFGVSLRQQNAERLHCLNAEASRAGLHIGMTCADARAFCPGLRLAPADPEADRRFLHALRRWATRYCPWVGLEGDDRLVLDITRSAHLFGGEEAMLGDMRQRMMRAGVELRLGLADTRGAAWALAHHGEGVAPAGDSLSRIGTLPVAALRLDDKMGVALQRLGLRTINDLATTPRAPLARRFGKELLTRLDQATGALPEDVSPLADPPHYGVRMTLPEPIGLEADVMAGLARLLDQLCAKLKRHEAGARALCLTLRRVDEGAQEVELRLARPLRDPARILPLFQRGVAGVEAGFGIDQLRLRATQVEPVAVEQVNHVGARDGDRLDDLVSRLGTRVGLENIQRLLPADSHIPERSEIIAPAAFSAPESGWVVARPRPLRLFAPEPIAAHGPRPPARFRWRRMSLATTGATGPERIAPEWWLEDDAWRTGLRDYWRVDTRQGRRLWMYHTPQNPGWFVQGEFA